MINRNVRFALAAIALIVPGAAFANTNIEMPSNQHPRIERVDRDSTSAHQNGEDGARLAAPSDAGGSRLSARPDIWTHWDANENEG